MSSVVVAFDEVEARFREKAPSFRLWDGLLLEGLARRSRLEPGDWGVLLHWLPSQDPALDPPARARIESFEDAIVDAAAIVVVPGPELQQTLRKRHPHRRIVLCEPGVREAFRAPLPSEAAGSTHAVELLTVANMLPAKGLLETLAVLASLRELDWRWHLVGDLDVDPQCTRRFDDEAQQFGLMRRIVRHGPLDARGVVERMDRADVFVFPSRFESYGIVLAEAAARALPVLAFRTGAAARLFRDEVDALLAPVGNVEAFARGLRRVIVDATLRARFRTSLRARARARSWDDALYEFACAVCGTDAVGAPPYTTRT